MTMPQAVPATEPYSAERRRLSEADAPAWLQSLRYAAYARFEKLGYPLANSEEWHYTDPAPFREPHPAATSQTSRITRDDVRAHGISIPEAHELVFVNGFYVPSLSTLKTLPAGVRVQSLGVLFAKEGEGAETHLGQIAQFEHNALAALNTALFSDGAFIDVSANVQLDRPVHIVFYGSTGAQPAIQFPRVLVHAGARSRTQLVETYCGPPKSAHITNAVTEIVLDEGAQVHHHKIQREPTTANHVHTVDAELGRDTILIDHNIALGSHVARTDIGAKFQGEGGDLTLNGLYVLTGDQHVDNHSRVDHARPNCQSRELYKGILDGTSRGVFYGKVVVQAGAMKTNATQTNKNLLLSDGALCDSTPALEINADDVKCAHGSTIGQLDPDSLFYLRSRGIDEATARSLLTFGFARDVLGQVRIPAVRSAIEELLLQRLPSGRAVREAMYDA